MFNKLVCLQVDMLTAEVRWKVTWGGTPAPGPPATMGVVIARIDGPSCNTLFIIIKASWLGHFPSPDSPEDKPEWCTPTNWPPWVLVSLPASFPAQ